ncbi:unnamed protein product [Ectocarpus sp. 4 AP-2014]
MYHIRVGDRYPNGCPNGNDPSKLLYELQMIEVLRKKAGHMFADAGTHSLTRKGGRAATKHDIVVHDLGSEDNPSWR